MRRKIAFIAAGALALTLMLPGAATATPPEEVTFTGTFVEGAFAGTFYNTPDMLCPKGTTADNWGVAAGWQTMRQVQLVLRKTFTCDDGSGTFTLLLQVHIKFDPYWNRFTWTVLEGTGDYAKLHGTGTGSAVEDQTGGIDTYVGELHFD